MSVVLATGGYDHKIRFWDAPSGECIRHIKHTDSQVNRLEITPDKQFIAAAGNPLIRVYEIMSSVPTPGTSGANANPLAVDPIQQPASTMEGHTGNVTALGFQQEGRFLYSGSEDGTVKVWDLRSSKYCRSYDSGAAVNSVALRIDRDEFISGDQDGYVKIWDFRSNKCINSVQPALSGKGDDGKPDRSRQIEVFAGSSVPIQAVDISEDSRTLVAISNRGTVYVWDPNGDASQMSENEKEDLDADGVVGADSGEFFSFLRPLTKFQANEPGSYCLYGKISPDCRYLVTTGSDGCARLWDTSTWELSKTLGKHKWVWDAAFCADSGYLVTASSDAVARLWDLGSGNVVKQYKRHQSAVTCVALNDSNA